MWEHSVTGETFNDLSVCKRIAKLSYADEVDRDGVQTMETY